MCSKVMCSVCKKATWSGCGQHIEQALAGVPKNERCAGHDASEFAASKSSGGIFKKLFGR